MKKITSALASITLGCCIASNVTHASIIQSMTVEEIGVASGGLGTSAAFSGGGRFTFTAAPSAFATFTSAGSADGAILMGVAQNDSAFTQGFIFLGSTVTPNTLAGAPSGMVKGGNLILNLSGWGINVSPGLGYFPTPPDVGTLLTSLSVKDATSYFYTADWSRKVTAADDPSGGFVSFTSFWHLEGIAIAAVPEPGTAWLVGAAFIGLLGVRRYKPV